MSFFARAVILKFDFKLLGCILLIVGTSIGAGMLALPIASAQLGFFGSLVLLFICWAIMTTSAFLILEVNLWLPQNSNLVSMAKATIGPIGQLIAWVAYLLLLYTLLSAYISGGSELFRNLISATGYHFPAWLSSILFTVFFGAIVFLGIRSVDYVNRGLMSVKFFAYFILIILLIPFIATANWFGGKLVAMTNAQAIMVTITSFGFATIVPSMRIYFDSNVQKLRLAILLGSIIPLICYIFWDAAIMGVIPLNGLHGLTAILQSKDSTSTMVNTVSATVARNDVTFFVKLFTSICVLTSFLGVALCMTDFLADGLSIEKKGLNRWMILSLALLPPLVLVLFFPNVFIRALQYAGVDCVVLLVLLPAWMAWRGRYYRKLSAHATDAFRVKGGKFVLSFLLILSVIIIVHGFLG